MRTLLVVAALVLSVGCGAKSAPVLMATEGGITASVLKVKGGIDTLCSESKPVLTVETCKSLYSALTPTIEAAKSFNRSARETSFDGLADLATKIANLMNAVKSVPQAVRGNLEADLRQALSFTAQ